MMSAIRSFFISSKLKHVIQPSQKSMPLQICRKVTQTPSGALLEKPRKLSLGVTKFFIVVTPCVYIGGMMSMKGASLLEDYDIFVPEDEDD